MREDETAYDVLAAAWRHPTCVRLVEGGRWISQLQAQGYSERTLWEAANALAAVARRTALPICAMPGYDLRWLLERAMDLVSSPLPAPAAEAGEEKKR